MKILLVNVPSRKGVGGFTLPSGLLYVGAIIERCGYHAKIIDPYLDDIELKDFDDGFFKKIDIIIKDYKPSIIGYSGIVTSYGRTKQLSLYIKSNYPEIMQIVGGPLASVYDLLLKKAKIDVVFHGEVEVSLPIFLERFEQKELIYDIPGVSYLLNGEVVRNNPAEQIKDLDSIPFPAYHLVDISQYLHPVKHWIDGYKSLLNSNPYHSDLIKTIGTKTHFIPIVTTRGCTHKCSFCYRHVQGIRQHSVSYVIDHIKYLKETYGISGFQFRDELFNSSYEWVMELCDAIEKNNLNIFYLVSGARVDKVDKQMLQRLKETGCIDINYGQESGSDIILKEYRKGINSQRNREITLLTKEVGLNCPVQLVIGSPRETSSTILETIQFLKDVDVIDASNFSLNYLIALPETPIWEYVKENKLIQDVEQYLDTVAEYGGAPLLNLTKEPDRVWKKWGRVIHKELKVYHYKKVKPKTFYFYVSIYFFMFSLVNIIEFLTPDRIRNLIPKSIEDIVVRILR